MDLVNFRKLIFLAMVLILPACSLPFVGGYGANGLSKEEFTRYVENVFRLQNKLTSQVMMLAESSDDNFYAPLLLAEQNMHKACRYLNEFASRDNEGLNIGFLLQKRVEKTALDCEKAANMLAVKLSESH